jgi:hypothetical protein
MKVALFAFQGEPMCFVHVLLNAFDLKEKGHEVAIVMEGAATRLVRELHEDPAKPFAALYERARREGLVDCVCRACAAQMGAAESAAAQGLPLADEMLGHPSMARFLADGYQVITF